MFKSRSFIRGIERVMRFLLVSHSSAVNRRWAQLQLDPTRTWANYPKKAMVRPEMLRVYFKNGFTYFTCSSALCLCLLKLPASLRHFWVSFNATWGTKRILQQPQLAVCSTIFYTIQLYWKFQFTRSCVINNLNVSHSRMTFWFRLFLFVLFDFLPEALKPPPFFFLQKRRSFNCLFFSTEPASSEKNGGTEQCISIKVRQGGGKLLKAIEGITS